LLRPVSVIAARRSGAACCALFPLLPRVVRALLAAPVLVDVKRVPTIPIARIVLNYMEFDPTKHHRRSIRLRGYDYSQRGIYFVTICTNKKECFLGKVSNGAVVLEDAGWAVRKTWLSLPERFPGAVLDQFVVMPNHLHGVIAIIRQTPRGGKKGAASSAPTTVLPTLGEMMRAFKSVSAIEINCILGRRGRPVWQRNYFEHIVRDGRDLEKIYKYMADNPLQWEFDRENPAAKDNSIPS
jgi:putative transposase